MSGTRFDFPDLSAFNGETEAPSDVQIFRDFSLPPGQVYRVRVRIGEQVYEGSGADAFWALISARELFEPLGWLLGVQGCSTRTRISGMLGDSGGGMSMYRHEQGSAGGNPEIVDTFAPAPRGELITAEEQLRLWRGRR